MTHVYTYVFEPVCNSNCIVIKNFSHLIQVQYIFFFRWALKNHLSFLTWISYAFRILSCEKELVPICFRFALYGLDIQVSFFYNDYLIFFVNSSQYRLIRHPVHPWYPQNSPVCSYFKSFLVASISSDVHDSTS